MIVASSRNSRPEQSGEDSDSRFFMPGLSSSEANAIEKQLLQPGATPRTGSRFAAPPPNMTPEKTEQLYRQQGGNGSRHKKGSSRLLQGQLPLEIVSKGRFEKSEPTIHHGQDLDVPTYIRRGVALN
jgi:hypothetical protein